MPWRSSLVWQRQLYFISSFIASKRRIFRLGHWQTRVGGYAEIPPCSTGVDSDEAVPNSKVRACSALHNISYDRTPALRLNPDSSRWAPPPAHKHRNPCHHSDYGFLRKTRNVRGFRVRCPHSIRSPTRMDHTARESGVLLEVLPLRLIALSSNPSNIRVVEIQRHANSVCFRSVLKDPDHISHDHISMHGRSITAGCSNT
ncbi:hypothetical protein F4808DRAFT_151341 [Astrocystis sublimbata]|nr:hypothetical protein F4808DRAFT_151341 [Astrocystis sublimbata]